MGKATASILISTGLILFLTTCREKASYSKSEYRHIKPEYSLVQIEHSGDTLHFPLNDSSYNQVESMNYFEEDGKELISFLDQRSTSLNIYDISSRSLIKKILLKQILKIKTPEKLAAYVKNLDSIFVGYKSKLYLIDSTGKIRKYIPFLAETTVMKPVLDNGNLPVMSGSKFYASVKPSGTLNSVKKCRNWKTMYEFDFSEKKAKVFYSFPEVYHSNLFGYMQLHGSYCYNKNKRFVFSFVADTNIYETDFSEFNVSYFAKSQNQGKVIGQLPDEYNNKDSSTKHFAINHAYGNIYFDEKNNRYLRVSREAVTISDYHAKKRSRIQSVIIMDHDFRIIGESQVDQGIDLSTLFCTRNGDMYARVNRSDEYAIHFMRLAYSDQDNGKTLLSGK